LAVRVHAFAPEQKVVGPVEETVAVGKGSTVMDVAEDVLEQPAAVVTITLYVFEVVALGT
jgi:hypothetical protein